MAQPPKKRPFVPSEQDRRLASEFRRKAEEISQPALAKIIGVSVRTLQRYIKLERAMRAQDVEHFRNHFDTEPATPPAINGHQADRSPLDLVLERHDRELSIAQEKRLRAMEASGLRLTEEQWEHLAVAILNGRQPSP